MQKHLGVSPFPAGEHKAAKHRQGNIPKTDTNKKEIHKRSQGRTHVYAKTQLRTTRRHQYTFLSYLLSAKTRSDRDFEMSLCYTPKAFSCLEETKYNINHCLELAPSFPKMYNITMF